MQVVCAKWVKPVQEETSLPSVLHEALWPVAGNCQLPAVVLVASPWLFVAQLSGQCGETAGWQLRARGNYVHTATDLLDREKQK